MDTTLVAIGVVALSTGGFFGTMAGVLAWFLVGDELWRWRMGHMLLVGQPGRWRHWLGHALLVSAAPLGQVPGRAAPTAPDRHRRMDLETPRSAARPAPLPQPPAPAAPRGRAPGPHPSPRPSPERVPRAPPGVPAPAVARERVAPRPPAVAPRGPPVRAADPPPSRPGANVLRRPTLRGIPQGNTAPSQPYPGRTTVLEPVPEPVFVEPEPVELAVVEEPSTRELVDAEDDRPTTLEDDWDSSGWDEVPEIVGDMPTQLKPGRREMTGPVGVMPRGRTRSMLRSGHEDDRWALGRRWSRTNPGS